MSVLQKLTVADFATFTGLFFAWLSIVLLMKGQPNWAIVVIMIAFSFDLLDGVLARKSQQDSSFGRLLDSYGDVFIYLVFSSMLFVFYLTPSMVVGLFIGFLILVFGGLRLARFNLEGMKREKDRAYYRGMTVVHILFLTIICYFLSRLTRVWTANLSTLTLLIASPAMISNYKSYKIEKYWLFALVVFSVIVTSFIVEYAY